MENLNQLTHEELLNLDGGYNPMEMVAYGIGYLSHAFYEGLQLLPDGYAWS